MNSQEKRKCRICGCAEGDEDLCSACKTAVLSFVSTKGDVDKTNIVMLDPLRLVATGKRVLLLDSEEKAT